MADDDALANGEGDLDELLDGYLRHYLAKAYQQQTDALESSRWGQNFAKVFTMIEARAGRGGGTGEIGALAEAMLVPDDPDAQVGAMVDRYGREEVLRVIGEQVNEEAAGGEQR